MSNDQLSWDQLFQQSSEDEAKSAKPEVPAKQEPAKASSTGEVPPEPAFDVESKNPELASVSPKPKRKSTKRQEASQKPNSDAGAAEEKLYSKKDWSKLELGSAPKTKLDANTETTTIQQTELTVSTSTPPAAPRPVAKAHVTTVAKSTKVTEVSVHSKDGIEALDDLLSDGEVSGSKEPQVMTVSELNKHIRDILEGRFPILWLKGEISNFKAHTSGHFYFSLKDSKAQINAVMFRGFNSQLRFRPEDGMEVLIRGKITVYEPRGNYQIFCEVMEPVGAGALQKAFEQLKAKLQKEGLFDEAKKRPLPSLPKHIAIVTSPTGAAIRDMLNVLGRRFKGACITVIPCKVQGDQAPGEIVNAIDLANRLPDVDVMIVGRGGGSIEDLWAFNDERVARAIAAARVPVISAVGHEIDFTIADFVADLRAPTPSAAAELVVKNAADLVQQVTNLQRGLRFAVLRKLNTERQQVTSISKRLVDPQRRIQDAALRCDELIHRLEAGMGRLIQSRFMRIELLEERLGTPIPRIHLEKQAVTNFDGRLRAGIRNLLTRKGESLTRHMAVLDSLSPLRVLDRGFSMVTSEGKIITEASNLKVGQVISVKMCHGSVEAQVTRIEEKKKE